VVASFLEFAILLAIKNNHTSKVTRQIPAKRTAEDTKLYQEEDEGYKVDDAEEFAQYIYRIDLISLFIFSCTFLLFNVFYWYRFSN
jgi:hypothetical protein